MEGELLAEYPASGVATSPQKEYGYRNGQLLVTAEPAAEIKWLVADHLGTPRIIIDKTGLLANVKRHDYLPFGEELLAGTGGRTLAQGYSGDNIRQKFTSYEQDNETGLSYAKHRYYSTALGRFSSIDPMLGSGNVWDPASWNRYTYCLNRPSIFTDPLGLIWLTQDDRTFIWVDDIDYEENKNNYEGYREANGAVTQFQSSSNCDQCKDVRKGDWIQLKADGSIDQVDDPTLTINIAAENQAIDDAVRDYLSQAIGGTLTERGTVRNSSGSSYQNALGSLHNLNFEEFWNPHWDHWGGQDLQGQVAGSWYHVTLGYPDKFTITCDVPKCRTVRDSNAPWMFMDVHHHNWQPRNHWLEAFANYTVENWTP
jgi:RHS repeat-associated protein